MQDTSKNIWGGVLGTWEHRERQKRLKKLDMRDNFFHGFKGVG